MIISYDHIIMLCITSFVLGGGIIGLVVYINTMISNHKLLEKSRKAVDEAIEIRKYISEINKLHDDYVNQRENVIFEFCGEVSIPNMCAINSAFFKLANGNVVCLDRETTEFSWDIDGTFAMVWRHCYIWTNDGAEYLTNESVKEIFKDSQLLYMSIETEAPEDYEVHVNIWSFQ